MVYGDLMVEGIDGSKMKKEKCTAFCRCGVSKNKPYCDGTHKEINFND
ncbi:MAG: CDGSH iron-sulfur domain-containing protein [Bacteroidales bacterium]|nr:CDGSH iron-sulfur domain-containing protein [Bacteroidales bacterium]